MTTATQSMKVQDQFAREHKWLLLADGPTMGQFYARWNRAEELPGIFYGGGDGVWDYHKEILLRGQPGAYVVSVHGCTCPDASNRAPNGWCKHRIRVWIIDRHLRRLAAETVRDHSNEKDRHLEAAA